MRVFGTCGGSALAARAFAVGFGGGTGGGAPPPTFVMRPSVSFGRSFFFRPFGAAAGFFLGAGFAAAGRFLGEGFAAGFAVLRVLRFGWGFALAIACAVRSDALVCARAALR